VILLFFLLPSSKDFLDFFRPLDLSSAIVAIFGLEKDLVFAVVAEESLLLGFLLVRHVRGPQVSFVWIV
jgi:hypothetical protein